MILLRHSLYLRALFEINIGYKTNLENFNITELKNGIKIVSEKIPHLKSFSLGFWFNVGSRDETETNNGISHFIEHMMFKGTTTRSARVISDEIESLGGYLNAYTSKEHTCYYGRGLTEHIDKTFEVLSDMVLNSVFDPLEVKKESTVVIDELYDIEDTPEEVIFDKFESEIYAGCSLGLPIIGTEDNLTKFTRDDILNYINTNYTSDRFMVVASGNIDHSKLVKLAEKYLSGRIATSGSLRLSGQIKNPGNKHFKKDIQQAHVIVGTVVPGYDNHERVGINVLSHILGEGSSSRIFQRVREEHGLTYQINTFLNSFADTSTFGVYFSTNESSVAKVIELVSDELDLIRNTEVTLQEIQRAKEYFKGNIILGLENTTNRMVRIANSMFYYRRIKQLEETVAEIDAVNSELIQKLAEKYLDNKKLIKIILSGNDLLFNSAA